MSEIQPNLVVPSILEGDTTQFINLSSYQSSSGQPSLVPMVGCGGHPSLLKLEDNSSKSALSFAVPAIRIISEFDSDNRLFLHKLSCKFLDTLAKLKLTFQHDHRGHVSLPNLALVSDHFSLHYHPQQRNALIKGSLHVSQRLQFRATADVMAKKGEVAIIAKHSDPPCNFEMACDIPFCSMPKATFTFPHGQVELLEKMEEQRKKTLSINGAFSGHLIGSGICMAQLNDTNFSLQYSYKDGDVSFIPKICLPLNSLSFAFKRRFSPSDKVSYWYEFETKDWSAVYKHNMSKDLKIKMGYDSQVRLGWASLWVGEECGKSRFAPLKMKAQIMMQVPQDHISSPLFMFRVKKRWDL